MRKKIVAGNWKMNKSFDDGIKLATEVTQIAASELNSNVQLVICTPFIHLSSVSKVIGSTKNVFLGAQNISNKESGAYTGEISAEMIKSVGASYVILGHSERREYFQESDAMLAEKVNIALKLGLTPIFCCGETLSQREAGIHMNFVKQQLTNSLFHLSSEDFAKIVIAYEPIWAIGTGVTATSAQAQEMHAELRKHLASKYGEVGKSTSILYGGSAKPSNAKELFACADIDGGLIGGASLVARDFIDIAKSF
ncbi:MAG: triose-phosphate isomerase [Bacteroidota bacterium]|nr:triose-phosphate isomerase [Bacteroidota bacterium]